MKYLNKQTLQHFINWIRQRLDQDRNDIDFLSSSKADKSTLKDYQLKPASSFFITDQDAKNTYQEKGSYITEDSIYKNYQVDHLIKNNLSEVNTLINSELMFDYSNPRNYTSSSSIPKFERGPLITPESAIIGNTPMSFSLWYFVDSGGVGYFKTKSTPIGLFSKSMGAPKYSYQGGIHNITTSGYELYNDYHLRTLTLSFYPAHQFKLEAAWADLKDKEDSNDAFKNTVAGNYFYLSIAFLLDPKYDIPNTALLGPRGATDLSQYITLVLDPQKTVTRKNYALAFYRIRGVELKELIDDENDTRLNLKIRDK